MWEPHLLILDDGTFVEFYSDETHKREGCNQLLGHKVSKDGGKTWGPLVFNAANPGGVERPGMVIIDRLPDRRYVYNYEDVDGPVRMQVHLKFSKDGLNSGIPEDRGTPVRALSGRYARSTPNVFWFPVGGPKGVIVVTSGGMDRACPGRCGQHDLLEQQPGRGTLVGSSFAREEARQLPLRVDAGTAAAAGRAVRAHHVERLARGGCRTRGGSRMLFNVARIDFNRYEAESAGQKGSIIMRDGSMSNGAKSRLGAKQVGKLSFPVHVPSAGKYDLAVEYSGIGFEANPRRLLGERLAHGWLGRHGADRLGTRRAARGRTGDARQR